MPTLSVGRASSAPAGSVAAPRENASRGITLLEMLVVMGIVSLLAAISFPSVSSGLDSLRMTSATNSIVSLLNAGLNRAERKQQVVEVEISKEERALRLRSTDPAFAKRLDLPEGIQIVAILPEPPQPLDGPRRFLLYPGATVPRFGLEISNARGARRIIRVDPITGVPQIEQLGRR